jgi:hypothetical protein
LLQTQQLMELIVDIMCEFTRHTPCMIVVDNLRAMNDSSWALLGALQNQGSKRQVSSSSVMIAKFAARRLSKKMSSSDLRNKAAALARDDAEKAGAGPGAAMPATLQISGSNHLNGASKAPEKKEALGGPPLTGPLLALVMPSAENIPAQYVYSLHSACNCPSAHSHFFPSSCPLIATAPRPTATANAVAAHDPVALSWR